VLHPNSAIAVLLFLYTAAATAEVKQSAPESFFLSYSTPISASTAKAYTDVTQVQRWWSSEHTFSGKASNLSLKAEAGGCFCEKWSGGSVEHGRVIMALPGKLLRLDSALGPLQEFALKGILSFWIKNEDGATSLTVEYRVNGTAASGLDALAPNVDEVLGAQVDRLKRYIGTGNPEAPVAEETKDASKATDAAKPGDSPKVKPADPKKKPKPAVPAKP